MRRLYYIRPNLQHAFTLLFTILTAVEIFLFGCMLFFIEKISFNYPADLRIYWKFSSLFFVILIFSAFNFWIGTRLSHRIAGPMVQIQRVLQHAISGKYNYRVKMRSNDYLHEIGDNLNVFLEELERKTRQTTRDRKEISKQI